MIISTFDEVTVNIAEKQEEYITLPAYCDDKGFVLACWELEEQEVERIKKSRFMGLTRYTFRDLVQPTVILTEKPEDFDFNAESLKQDQYIQWSMDNKLCDIVLVLTDDYKENVKAGDKIWMLTNTGLGPLQPIDGNLVTDYYEKED